MERSALIDLIIGAAKFRKDPDIPRDYITEALERIDKGVIEVERYPMGAPTMKGVYEIASKLFMDDQLKQTKT